MIDNIKAKLQKFLESDEELKDYSFYVVIIDDNTNDVQHLYNACPVCVREEIDRFIDDVGIEHLRDRGIH